ncbi:hypothetical protein PG987_008017 [Apiospora arundinis]
MASVCPDVHCVAKRAESLDTDATTLEKAYKDALKRIDALEDEKEADGQLFRASAKWTITSRQIRLRAPTSFLSL